MAPAARVLLLLAALLPALPAQKANEDYSTPEKRAAQAVSLSDPGRPERLKAQAIVESLHLRPGMSVADIGAGAGIMLPFLSKAVGASGRTLPWALTKGAPELIQAVDEGRFSLSAAEAAQEL
jgi:predicted methyltransferase